MKAHVVEFSNMATIGMAVCPPQHHGNEAYIRNSFSNIDQALVSADPTFYERVRNQIEQFYDPIQLNIARQELSGHGDIFLFDNFVHYRTIEEIQSANRLMQDYIMAMSVVRELYQRQAIDGFSETYEENRSVSHEDMWQYWEMRDGVLQFDNNTITQFEIYQDIPEDAVRMSPVEQAEMADLEDLITHYLKNNRLDVTNKFGGEVGG